MGGGGEERRKRTRKEKNYMSANVSNDEVDRVEIPDQGNKTLSSIILNIVLSVRRSQERILVEEEIKALLHKNHSV